MKVLQVSKFYWPVRGGIESAVFELTEGLNRAGSRTDVLCANQRPVNESMHFDGGYDVVRAASLGMLLSTSIAPAMVSHLRRLAPHYDVFHLHMPDPMAALALWLVRPRGRVVVHWHSDVMRQRKALKVYGPLQRWMLGRADAIVATSQAYADASLPLKPWGQKVQVIPIGISDRRSRANTEKAGAIRRQYRGRKLVFSLGRMTYYKGFDVLIEAAAALPDDTAVLIGGAGSLLESFKRDVARRGLAGKVHLLGAIDDSDLPSHFEACDLFCLPSKSRSEAYGVAMVEAMMMGKPIIAADIAGSGVPWVNESGVTGLNVPVGEPAALAQALIQLLADAPMRQRFAQASRQRYVDEFTAERMTARTIEMYEALGWDGRRGAT
jgi:rhamnosyl/mannosyltransferase